MIGFLWGLSWDNGKENENYWGYRDSIRILGYILGLCWDKGKRKWKLLGV